MEMVQTVLTTTSAGSSDKPETQNVENERNLYKTTIQRSYARDSALLEPTAIKPPDSVLDDQTLQEEPQMQEGLSDLTDADDCKRSHTKSLSKKLIIRLLNDPRVWSLAALNLLAALTSFIILITSVVFLVEIFDVNETIAKFSNREQPCLYQWSEWGPCSETCSSSSRLPSRSRHVLNRTIIQARGHFPSCPKNLETTVEHLPCNIYRCPVVLSSFTNWTECTYKDPNSQTAGGCYKIRDLPTTNQLIYIDTTEFVVDCECPDQIV